VKVKERWPLVLATVPLWPIVWLILLASLARLKLGYWPSYGHPDPKDLNWPIPDMTGPLLLLAPIAAGVALAAGIRAWYVRRWNWRFLLTVCSFAVFVLWFLFDPGGLFEWWAD
jgi:hypothetical protein